MSFGPLTVAYEKLKKYILSVKYEPDVLIPVLTNNHWTLLLVKLVEGKILHYDSLHGNHFKTGKAACQTMATVMQFFFKNRIWEWQVVYGLPQQSNSFDCGVYVCRYIDLIYGYLSTEQMRGWLPLNWSLMERDSIKGVISIRENS